MMAQNWENEMSILTVDKNFRLAGTRSYPRGAGGAQAPRPGFQDFFRRLKVGQKPGFPRFKSADRFPGWGYQEHGNLWIGGGGS